MAIKARRVNILCIIGAIIGICSFFIPWLLVTWDQNIDGNPERLWYLTLFDLVGNSEFTWVFILSSISALFTPVAGFLQLIGWAGLYRSLNFAFADMGQYEFSKEVGYAIGLLSFMMVIISLIRPMGIGFSKGPLSIKKRMLTFCKESNKAS